MRRRTLGRTGIEVSEIGFGAWAIGGPWSIAALNAALDVGITFFDTADAYGWGHSEELVGKAFTDKRDQVVVARCQVTPRFPHACTKEGSGGRAEA